MWALSLILVASSFTNIAAQVQTSTGTDCKFPFTYKGSTYSACVPSTLFPGKAWCATVDALPETIAPNAWGYCIDGNAVTSPPGGGATPVPAKCLNPKMIDGRDCYPSWIYNGVRYVGCINLDAQRPWCTLGNRFVSGNLGTWGQWGYCNIDADCPINVLFEPNPVTAPPTGCSGTQGENGRLCVFPFTYNGVTYNECTVEGSASPWCSFDAVYQGSWGYCRLSQTVNGDACQFPFRYSQEGTTTTYSRCTIEYDGRAWCARDNPYQQGRWGYCQLC